MSNILNRIADYFAREYQGDDKTSPTMEITVGDMRYIASMNVDRCRAEAELRNIKQGGVSDDVCEWKLEDEEANLYLTGCQQRQLIFDGTPKENGYRYCPYCGKKIKIVGD